MRVSAARAVTWPQRGSSRHGANPMADALRVARAAPPALGTTWASVRPTWCSSSWRKVRAQAVSSQPRRDLTPAPLFSHRRVAERPLCGARGGGARRGRGAGDRQEPALPGGPRLGRRRRAHGRLGAAGALPSRKHTPCRHARTRCCCSRRVLPRQLRGVLRRDSIKIPLVCDAEALEARPRAGIALAASGLPLPSDVAR